MSCCFEAPISVADGGSAGQHWVNVTLFGNPTVTAASPITSSVPSPGFSLTFDGHYHFPPPIAVTPNNSPASCRLTDASGDQGGTSWICTGTSVRFRVDTLPSAVLPGIAMLVSSAGQICVGKTFCPLLVSDPFANKTSPGSSGGDGASNTQIVIILVVVIVSVMCVGIGYVIWRRNRKLPEPKESSNGPEGGQHVVLPMSSSPSPPKLPLDALVPKNVIKPIRIPIPTLPGIQQSKRPLGPFSSSRKSVPKPLAFKLNSTPQTPLVPFSRPPSPPRAPVFTPPKGKRLHHQRDSNKVLPSIQLNQQDRAPPSLSRRVGPSQGSGQSPMISYPRPAPPPPPPSEASSDDIPIKYKA